MMSPMTPMMRGSSRGLPLALTQTLLRAWERRLVNRALPYAVQQPDGTYRWRYQACTLDDLAAHLYGETTLALSCTDGRGHCKWLCLDGDTPDALQHLLTLRAALADQGFPALVEGSRRGAHLWLFFERPVAVTAARGVFLAVLTSLSMTLAGYELYPDAPHSGMLGHAVRLPLGVHLLTGLRYPLYDAQGRPCLFATVRQAVEYLLTQPRLSAKVIRAQWLALGARSPAPGGDGTPDGAGASATQERQRVGTFSPVIRWVDAHVAPLDLLADLAPDCELRQVGQGYLGWCPFHDDRAADEAGKPGTPSFYVVRDRRHGWSWKCFSTNCRYSWGMMRHSFELFQHLLDLSVKQAILAACQQWSEADQDQRPTQTQGNR